MFNSKQELIVALTEGRRFRTENGIVLFYDNEFNNPFRRSFISGTGDSGPISVLFNQFDKVTEDQPWYKNISKQGVLCKAWDVKNNTYIVVVDKYTTNSVHPFKVKTGASFINATPLTRAEALDLVVGE